MGQTRRYTTPATEVQTSRRSRQTVGTMPAPMMNSALWIAAAQLKAW